MLCSKGVKWIIKKPRIMHIKGLRIHRISNIRNPIEYDIVNGVPGASLIKHAVWVAGVKTSAIIHVSDLSFHIIGALIYSLERNGIWRCQHCLVVNWLLQPGLIIVALLRREVLLIVRGIKSRCYINWEGISTLPQILALAFDFRRFQKISCVAIWPLVFRHWHIHWISVVII